MTLTIAMAAKAQPVKFSGVVSTAKSGSVRNKKSLKIVLIATSIPAKN